MTYANFLRLLVSGPGVGRYAITQCIVDTGASFSIVAEDQWRRFQPGFVTPLPFDAQTPLALRATTIAGGTFPYTLGQLSFNLQDFDRTILTIIKELLSGPHFHGVSHEPRGCLRPPV